MAYRKINNAEGQILMSRWILSLVVALGLQVITGALGAQETEQVIGVLEAKIPQLMESEHVPGLSMVLIRQNRIVWKGVFGVRSAGEPQKVNDRTVFEAASMSKPLFSYGVLKLVEQGRFDLDRPLDSYLPEPYLPDQSPAKKITARMVMLHRTGLPNWRKGGWRKGGPLRVLHEPGTRFTYSGEGYLYLQTVIERLTGKSVDAWTQESLLRPLGMTDSSYVWRESFEDNFAGGHDKNGNLKKSRRFYRRGNAAFSLYTTPTDYARFLMEIMKPDRSARHSLKAETVKKMTTLQVTPEKAKQRSRRSLGWVVASRENGGWVCHSGSNGSGFRCNSRFNMKRKSGCVIMANSDSGRKVWESILRIIDSMGGEDEPASKAGKVTTWGSVQRTIKYDYRIMNPTSRAATKLDVYVPLPLDSPHQEIHYLHLPESGKQGIFTDVHGQKLAHYSFDSLEAGEWKDLGFVVGLTLRNMRCNATRESVYPDAPVLTPEQRERYLMSETNYSMESDLMGETAADLTRDAASDFDKLVRIHDHIIGAIRYVRDNKWDPAAVVLARGTGSCSEYNYVLSGLCRLAGLPTRCVGGTTSGFRALPTTDTVFHRWTEVFLSGYGWFPADCSRDANPIRGKRSHFGRVYVDAMVWCRQAGGEQDSLGWDYRAKLRVKGDDPGVRQNHRTRWFTFYPQEQLEAAYAWFSGDAEIPPEPDLLECALLHWDKASVENCVKMIRTLAASGRNACLRRAAGLPEAEGLRQSCVQELCDSPALAQTILEKSRHLYHFRSWFRSHESNLLPTSDGRFELAEKAEKEEVAFTTASSSQIWAELAAELVSRLAKSLDLAKAEAVVVMPVQDQSMAGLGEKSASIHADLKDLISRKMEVKLIDEVAFDRLMQEQGPGSKEYWILANGDRADMPAAMVLDIILVPLCITERSTKEKGAVLYHLEFKALDLSSRKYTRVVARKYRRQGDAEPRAGRGLLVAGGDTVLARWEHDMVGRNGYDWPLAGVKSVLSAADAALCNLECCISLRGIPADKGERCPFYYRARPEMLRCLTGAGIDIVTAANNHGGDYGPVSVTDTAMWCERAGLLCIGVGNRAAAAEQPRLVRVGPVRVGVVGMDTTMAHFRAEKGHPGTNYVSAEDLTTFAEKTRRLGRWAERRCDLLVLTIHWGDNWVRQTQPAHRDMARIAFENGVDLILGHSAHRLQGIELVNGKVAIYDMGNLLFDCELRPEGRRSALFRLHFRPNGVHKVEVIPTQVLNGHTVLAGYEEAHKILTETQNLCSSLGTRLVIDEDVEGRPVGIINIPEPRATSRSEPDPAVAFAAFPIRGEEIEPSISEAALVSEIPKDAHEVLPPAELAPGVELLASRLPDTAVEGGILRLSTWWRVTSRVDRNVMPAFQLSVEGETPRRATPWYTRHDPGDWAMPLSLLKPGQIIEDRYPARLVGLPAGPCKVYAVVIDTTRAEGGRIIGEQRLPGEVQILPRTKK
jgi:CubicO group peptidase (beta-lactamase class C family)/poly-gamma-glutamate capsule biosynthesis protein CapA/YwtB (metallophosphatase superfamily)